VIHDVVSPYGNIDHIVLNAQGGIFLIETKAHGGRVSVVDGRLLVNGHDPEGLHCSGTEEYLLAERHDEEAPE
jgi:hypothetical protein